MFVYNHLMATKKKKSQEEGYGSRGVQDLINSPKTYGNFIYGCDELQRGLVTTYTISK